MLSVFHFDSRVADNLSIDLLNKSLMACTGRGDLWSDKTTQRCHEYIYSLKRDLSNITLRYFKNIPLESRVLPCSLKPLISICPLIKILRKIDPLEC